MSPPMIWMTRNYKIFAISSFDNVDKISHTDYSIGILKNRRILQLEILPFSKSLVNRITL
jgi:hypothetical protein